MSFHRVPPPPPGPPPASSRADPRRAPDVLLRDRQRICEVVAAVGKRFVPGCMDEQDHAFSKFVIEVLEGKHDEFYDVQMVGEVPVPNVAPTSSTPSDSPKPTSIYCQSPVYRRKVNELREDRSATLHLKAEIKQVATEIAMDHARPKATPSQSPSSCSSDRVFVVT